MWYQMKTFRLTVEVAAGRKNIVTLLDDSRPRPTVAVQMGDTIEEAVRKIAPYIEREVIREDIERDIIEGRT